MVSEPRVVQFKGNRACYIKSASRYALSKFCNHSPVYLPNCTPLSPIIISNKTMNVPCSAIVATAFFFVYLTDEFFVSRISQSFDYFFTGLCAVQFYLIIVVFPKSGSRFALICFFEPQVWLQNTLNPKSMFIFILLAFTKVSIAGISAGTGTVVATYGVHTFWVLPLAFSPLLAFIYV